MEPTEPQRKRTKLDIPGLSERLAEITRAQIATCKLRGVQGKLDLVERLSEVAGAKVANLWMPDLHSLTGGVEYSSTGQCAGPKAKAIAKKAPVGGSLIAN